MKHPVIKWSLRIVVGLMLTVVLLVAAVLGYLFYGDETLLPPRLERLATLALDRPVHIEGKVVLEPGLEPRIAISGLRIDNADWAQAPHLATLGRVDVTIRLLPLFSGVLEILSIELEDLDVQLERSADGQDNWSLGRRGVPQGPPPTLPLIHLLDFENLSIAHSAPGEPARRIVIREAFSKGLGAERFELAAYGDLMGRSFSLLAEGGEVDTLLEQSSEWPLLVKLNLPNAVGEITGHLRGPVRREALGMDLWVRLEGQQFEEVDQALGLGTTIEGPFGVRLRADGEGSNYRIHDIHAFLGANDLRGELSWAGSQRTPRLSARLRSRVLDIGSLAPLVGAPSGDDTVDEDSIGEKTRGSGFHLPDLSPLSALDADVELAVESLRLPRGQLNDLALKVDLRDGRLGLEANEGEAAKLSATLDSTTRSPTLELDARLARSDVSGSLQWLERNQRPRIQGELRSKTIATAELEQFAARFWSAEQQASSSGGAGLPVPLPVDLDLKLGLGRLVDEKAPLEKVAVEAQLEGSVLRLPSLALSADGTDLKASATLDLSGREPRLELSARAWNFELGRTLPALISPGKVRVALSDATMELTAVGKLEDLARNARYTIKSDHPGELRFHTSSGNIYKTTLSSARMIGNADKPVQVTLVGSYDGKRGRFSAPAEVSGTINDTQSLLFGGGPYRINAEGESRSTRARVDVTFSIPDGPDIDGDFDLEGSSLAELSPFVETDLPDRGPYRMVFHLMEKGDDDVFDFKRFDVGQSRGAVRITVNWAGDRPRVNSRGVAEVLHLADLLTPELAIEQLPDPVQEPDAKKATPKASERIEAFPEDPDQDWSAAEDKTEADVAGRGSDSADAEHSANDERVIPNFRFDPKVLNALNGTEELKVRRLVSRTGEELGALDFRMELENGRLVIGPVTGSIAGSEGTFKQVVDRSTSPASAEVWIDLKGFDLGAFLKAEGITDDVEGKLDLSVDLKGEGDNFREVLGNSTGKVTLVGGKGKVPKQLMRLWGGDLTRAVFGLLPLSDDPTTELNCIVMPATVTDGQASIPAFLVDSTEVTVVGQADLDLRTEQIDALLKPGPKDPSLVSLALPLKIEGTLGNPDVGVTESGKALAAGKAVIAIINPLTIPLLFGDLGTSDKNPCEVALERLKKGEPLKPDSGRPSSLNDVVEGATEAAGGERK